MDAMVVGVALARMVVGHMLADGLQGRLSGLKRRRGPNGVPKTWTRWLPYLALHGVVHGLAVWWALGSAGLGLTEAACHSGIDYGKCEGKYGAYIDQALHAGCKLIWLGVFWATQA